MFHHISFANWWLGIIWDVALCASISFSHDIAVICPGCHQLLRHEGNDLFPSSVGWTPPRGIHEQRRALVLYHGEPRSSNPSLKWTEERAFLELAAAGNEGLPLVLDCYIFEACTTCGQWTFDATTATVWKGLVPAGQTCASLIKTFHLFSMFKRGACLCLTPDNWEGPPSFLLPQVYEDIRDNWVQFLIAFLLGLCLFEDLVLFGLSYFIGTNWNHTLSPVFAPDISELSTQWCKRCLCFRDTFLASLAWLKNNKRAHNLMVACLACCFFRLAISLNHCSEGSLGDIKILQEKVVKGCEATWTIHRLHHRDFPVSTFLLFGECLVSDAWDIFFEETSKGIKRQVLRSR